MENIMRVKLGLLFPLILPISSSNFSHISHTNVAA